MTPEMTRVGSAYQYLWQDPGVSIEIDDVHRSRGDWAGWIRVRTTAPGVPPHLAEGKQTLSSISSRSSLARLLNERMPDTDWVGLLEAACILTVRAEKAGDPFEAIGSRPPDAAPAFVMPPFVRRNNITTFFGDGGVFKSTMGMLVAVTVASGEEICGWQADISGPVLYLDWETDRDDLDDTHKRIAKGLGRELPDIHYRREVWPLHQSAPQIRRFIDVEGIVLVVVDSVGQACGEDVEKAEAVLRFFQGVRSLGVAALCIDHVTHDSTRGKPFGSVYKHNASRLTFEFRKQEGDGDETHVGIFNRKANKGPLAPPIGLAVSFDYESIRFRREEVKAPALRSGLSASKQITLALSEAKEALTVANIADVTGLKQPIARARVNELVKTRVVQCMPIREGPNKYGLRSNKEDE